MVPLDPSEPAEPTGRTGPALAAIERLPRPVILAIGLCAVAVLGGLDYLTGREISFSIFYLGPVTLMTWASGRRLGLFLAFVAATVWGVVDVAGGPPYSHALLLVWNAFVRLGFFSITVWLIADTRRAHEAVRALARLDPLTGVANGRTFHELLDREIARLHRTASPLTLAYVDLDHFKDVNDTLGHAAGDDLLRAIGTQLTATLRATDSVARLGGDEFTLLLPDTDVTAASQALERFRSNVLASIEGFAGVPDGVGATIGAVVFLRPPPNADQALRAADQRMYEGKRAGRSQVLVSRWPSA